ncbi:MAG: cation:proton antiporter [Pirellulales bacterium]|nr:cation:proton antiporter [Pirellulales bacterium]
MQHPSLYLAAVLALGIAAQWVAWRFRLPAIVLLLGFGVLLGRLGPETGSSADQDFFFAFVSLAVGIILFEGGLSLNFRELGGTGGVVFRLVTVGLVITWLLTAWLAHAIAGFSIAMSLLLGALLTVSGPTVVLPLLRHVQPVRRIGSLAKWEGIVNDPIGAVLAALVFEVILHYAPGEMARGWIYGLGITLLCAVPLSIVSAWLLLQLLRRYWVPDYLQNPVILSWVLLIFALSNRLAPESGLVTVTLLGVMLANQRDVAVRHIVEFKENLRVLLISTLFIVLASRLEISMEALETLGWRSALFVVLLILVVRPLAVFAATIGSQLPWQERAFLAWIHPRGIVAAAVGSLFALEIALAKDLANSEVLQAEADRFELVTFLVIVATVTVYGLTLAPLARRLGLSGENPQGILFAGASRAVREIAQAVAADGFPVLLVDTNPRNNAATRMAGLSVAYASIGSEYVQEQIDLGGIGRLLAMTPNDEVNTLAAMGFVERFGRAEVYQVATNEASSDRTERVGAYRGGRTLFNMPVTIQELEKRFADGARIKKTLLTSDFTYDDFMARYGETALVLFRTDVTGKKLLVATAESETSPRPGQKVFALVDDQQNSTS